MSLESSGINSSKVTTNRNVKSFSGQNAQRISAPNDKLSEVKLEVPNVKSDRRSNTGPGLSPRQMASEDDKEQIKIQGSPISISARKLSFMGDKPELISKSRRIEEYKGEVEKTGLEGKTIESRFRMDHSLEDIEDEPFHPDAPQGFNLVKIEHKYSNCLFRALSQGLEYNGYKANVPHEKLRAKVVDFIREKVEYRNEFQNTDQQSIIDENYLKDMARPGDSERGGRFGGAPEILAFSKMTGIQIIVHHSNGSQENFPQDRLDNGRKPISLMFNDGLNGSVAHYDLLIPENKFMPSRLSKGDKEQFIEPKKDKSDDYDSSYYNKKKISSIESKIPLPRFDKEIPYEYNKFQQFDKKPTHKGKIKPNMAQEMKFSKAQEIKTAKFGAVPTHGFGNGKVFKSTIPFQGIKDLFIKTHGTLDKEKSTVTINYDHFESKSKSEYHKGKEFRVDIQNICTDGEFKGFGNFQLQEGKSSTFKVFIKEGTYKEEDFDNAIELAINAATDKKAVFLCHEGDLEENKKDIKPKKK